MYIRYNILTKRGVLDGHLAHKYLRLPVSDGGVVVRVVVDERPWSGGFGLDLGLGLGCARVARWSWSWSCRARRGKIDAALSRII